MYVKMAQINKKIEKGSDQRKLSSATKAQLTSRKLQRVPVGVKRAWAGGLKSCSSIDICNFQRKLKGSVLNARFIRKLEHRSPWRPPGSPTPARCWKTPGWDTKRRKRTPGWKTTRQERNDPLGESSTTPLRASIDGGLHDPFTGVGGQNMS